MRRIALVGAAVVLAAAACGGRGPTLAEYAEGAEELVASLRGELDRLERLWEAQPPTVAGAAAYWDGRLAARVQFADGLRSLRPPADFRDLHASYIDLFDRLEEAERALAARVAAAGEVTDHWAWWNTAEGRVALVIEMECARACYAAQQFLDATNHRASLAEAAWVPREMREVVRVSFSCDDW